MSRPPEVAASKPAVPATQERPRVLAVILGQTRAHELTWGHFKKNVLDVTGADLAVCVSEQYWRAKEREMDPFTRTALYRWFYPELEDWALAFDQACNCTDCWRPVLKVKWQLFGGILDPTDEHIGSAGILLFYRWFLLQNLYDSGAIIKYDYFMHTAPPLSRSDFYYEAPHPAFSPTQDPRHMWVPEGEDYDGLTDRHMVASRLHIHSVLGLMEPICASAAGFVTEMNVSAAWNLEIYIKYTLEKHGIWKYVKRFPRVMYAVRRDEDPTRWSQGEVIAGAPGLVKYPEEFNATRRNVGNRAWMHEMY
ncbi:hypothetical protein HYH03_013538 [Edaphochlamys debaryana]|uniref:Uncharacterized protein n=1 Tax=Edaphochlamys debaryana TaxID=47281 RepID=A0A835XT99_9CHLO|nr:hypothetical protein HYH03_013538 [Edaphochlamys debaryana]|eukprot:KAG2487821.1 hypothetical protein HYH03_013538 [Edaphochlamys debaryana]